MATKRVPSISPVPSLAAVRAPKLNIKCCSRFRRLNYNKMRTLSAAITRASSTTRLQTRRIRRSYRARSNSITTFKTKKLKSRAHNRSRISATSDRAHTTAIPVSATCTRLCLKRMWRRASHSKRSRKQPPTPMTQTLKRLQTSAQFCRPWQTCPELPPQTQWGTGSKRCGYIWRTCWAMARSLQHTST